MIKITITLLFILLCTLQYKVWFQDGGVSHLWHLHQQVLAETEQNTTLTDRNIALAAEVRDLKQGTAAIEERARTELGMVKDGEQFYQFI